ncbi:NADP-dependent oxidoreductase [Aeromicrobium sp.]|uniref:NADP-dependent oxidoreductase n=1 Tax=Aeromicrobium sp. TaxID=1871063 RepID=UPI0019B23225|nr:NADP-dependent oxidoreductase [Aeromicrobium sp.]MBC7631339.1 NADP-dependent oxidoreductase [Aeromicrobium sp.]
MAITTRAVTLVRRPHAEPQADDFAVVEVPVPLLRDGQLLVRNAFMSVDPSMRGRLEETEKHYTTNFQVGQPLDGSAVGLVVQSADRSVPVGTYVRHRLGWRELAVVDAAAVSVVDRSIAPLSRWLGVLGQTGFTAYVGLVRAADLRPGDSVFVSAAAGAVGTAAGQFARLLGASRVVGSAGGQRKAAMLLDEFGLDGAVDYRSEQIRAGLERVAPDGIDVYFDNVGGDHLVAALDCLRVEGRVALCGMISQVGATGPRPGIDHLILAVLKRVTLRGFIVRDHEDLRPEFEERVGNWLRSGELVSKQTVAEGIEGSVDAFLGMLRGVNVGKMLVRLDPAVAE